MFDRSEELTGLADAVYSACSDIERGDVLAHDVIRVILGVEPHQGSWDQVIRKVRKRLRDERGIATWPAIGVGYKLLTEKETIEKLPNWRQQRARRQVRRGIVDVQALPIDDLTPHQQRVRSMRIEQLRRINSDIGAEMRIDMALAAKPAGNPRVRPRPSATNGAAS